MGTNVIIAPQSKEVSRWINIFICALTFSSILDGVTLLLVSLDLKMNRLYHKLIQFKGFMIDREISIQYDNISKIVSATKLELIEEENDDLKNQS